MEELACILHPIKIKQHILHTRLETKVVFATLSTKMEVQRAKHYMLENNMRKNEVVVQLGFFNPEVGVSSLP